MKNKLPFIIFLLLIFSVSCSKTMSERYPTAQTLGHLNIPDEKAEKFPVILLYENYDYLHTHSNRPLPYVYVAVWNDGVIVWGKNGNSVSQSPLATEATVTYYRSKIGMEAVEKLISIVDNLDMWSYSGSFNVPYDSSHTQIFVSGKKQCLHVGIHSIVHSAQFHKIPAEREKPLSNKLLELANVILELPPPTMNEEASLSFKEFLMGNHFIHIPMIEN